MCPSFRFLVSRNIKNHSFFCKGSSAGKDCLKEVSVQGEHLPKPTCWKPLCWEKESILRPAPVWNFLCQKNGFRRGKTSVVYMVFLVCIYHRPRCDEANCGLVGFSRVLQGFPLFWGLEPNPNSLFVLFDPQNGSFYAPNTTF